MFVADLQKIIPTRTFSLQKQSFRESPPGHDVNIFVENFVRKWKKMENFS
jgi:hypothetical protein